MKKGFTLIEAVIAITIATIIALVVAVYIREGFSAWEFLSGQKNMALASRAAMNRVVKELRRIRQSTNITTHTTKEITFIDVESDTVTFSQSGSNLLRGSDILLENLQDPCGLAFTYHDASGAETAIPAQMSFVRCRLITVKGDNKYMLESAARIRVKRIK